MDRRTLDNIKNIMQGPSWRDLKRIVGVLYSQDEEVGLAAMDEITEALKTDLESVIVGVPE